jgi:RimJ/RimL family protein N-acetyltransferase
VRPALDCLRIEIDTNWIRDDRGRLLAPRVPEPDPETAPYLLWAAAREGTLLDLGWPVPEGTAQQLLEVHQKEPAPIDPADLPPWAERYGKIISEAVGPSVVARVPCFVMDTIPMYRLPHDWERSAEVVRSTDGRVVRRSAAMPPTNIDERRGPWAGVVVDGELVSHCSTARLWDFGAEAGTWTDPAYRGRGFAAAATAIWASMLFHESRLLFYCADETNRSSRAIAERLALRPIGWMWRLDPPP